MPSLDDTPGNGRDGSRRATFRLVREIGRGGTGIVHEAVEEPLGRRVALKVLSGEAVRNAGDLERFRREARAAGRLHHTNIVPVFGIAEHDGAPAIVMQLIEGRRADEVVLDDATSRSASATGAPRTRFQAAAELALQVADALAFAHARGILHRDVKPSNVLVDDTGTAWVTDFGLAQSDEDPRLTDTGDIVGTLRYMAPERFRGLSDARSDVYGLGLTLHELVSGRPAFEGSSQPELLQAVLHHSPPLLRQVAPRTPPDLELIVAKACAREPAARYPTADAMAADLRRFLAGQPVSARRPSLRATFVLWCRRSPVVAALSLAVGVLLVIVAGVSTLAALRLDRALGRAEAAELTGRQRLFDSLVAQARAVRSTKVQGQRVQSLEALGRAVTLAGELDLGAATHDTLRQEAVAATGLVDLVPAGAPVAAPWNPRDVVDATGRLEARIQDGGDVLVREVTSGHELARLPAATDGGLSSMRFSADGRRLAVLGFETEDAGVSVWDVRTARAVLPRGVTSAEALDFSPDGQFAFIALEQYGLRSLDLDSGTEQARADELIGVTEPCLRVSPDGRHVAWSAEHAAHVQVRDARTLRLEQDLVPAAEDAAGRACLLEWSPDGSLLALARNTHLEVFDARRGVSVGSLDGHLDSIRRLDFDPTGTTLASYAYDGTTRLWDADTGTLLLTAEVSAGLGFDGQGALLLRDGGSGLLQAHALAGLRDRRLLRAGRPVSVVRFSADGRLLFVATDSEVQIWETDSGRLLDAFPADPRCGDFDPVTREVILMAGGGLSRLAIEEDAGTHSPRWGAPVALALPAGVDLRCVLLPPGREEMLLLLREGAIATARRDGGSLRILAGRHRDHWRTATSPDGQFMASSAWNGHHVMVWDPSGAREAFPIEGTASIDRAHVAFTPDGRLLVAGTPSAYLTWNVGTWSPGVQIPRRVGLGLPGALSISDDSRWLLGSHDEDSVSLHDLRDGSLVATFPLLSRSSLSACALSPDGTRIAAGTKGGVIELWDLPGVRAELARLGLDWSEATPASR